MEFDKSSIERLKRTLYSRNEDVVPKEKRTPVQAEEEINVPKSWGEAPSFDIKLESVTTKKNNSFFNKFLLGSLIFFVAALVIAAFIFFGGFNMISSNNVDIQITAPSSVSSGEELPISLSVVNGNPTGLEEVSLYIDYPAGTQSLDSSNKLLTHDKIDLGSISKGASKDYTVRELLFGAKDEIKAFNLRLEYKVTGSNAVFSKEKTFNVTIGSSPLLLNVSTPAVINSGQTVTLRIDVTSNSAVVIKNSLVKIEYPFGFTYLDSNIKPIRDNSVWNIGDLKAGDKKTLTVTGVLVGQDLEDRSFRISAGTQSATLVADFDTALAASLATIGIRKSFFGLTIVSSGFAGSGQSVPVSIQWQNTLPDKIVNNHIEATLSGNALDRLAVSVGSGGFYKSTINTIVWDKNSTSNLVSLAAGDMGQVSFSVGALSPTQLNSLKNPHIDIHAVMTGERSGIETGTVSSSEDLTVKIPSTLALSSKLYRAVGPFTNTGSVPPRADRESTYTVTWTLTNTTNDLKDTAVSATLPVGVEWKAQTSPVSEKVSYDANSRSVFWDVGNVSSMTGFTNSAKEVSFQVGITPSVNQIGFTPTLVQGVTADATDTYAGTPIKVSGDTLTTRFSDPSFRQGQDIVTK